MVQPHKIVFFAITLVFQSCLSAPDVYILKINDLMNALLSNGFPVNPHRTKENSEMIKNMLLLSKKTDREAITLLKDLIQYQHLKSENFLVKLNDDTLFDPQSYGLICNIQNNSQNSLRTVINLTQEILSAYAGNVGMFDAAFDFIIIDDTESGVISVRKIYQSQTKKLLSSLVTPSWGTITVGLLCVISFLVLS